jgi:integrase
VRTSSYLHLPKKGWGRIDLAASASRAGTAWTDHGTAGQERGLKPRADNETRTIPIPPELVRLLHAHIKRYGTTFEGRIFQTARGGILQDSGCNESGPRPARRPSPPPSNAPRSAAAHMTCGTRRCRCG